MSTLKTILICQYPLPYAKIASWTNMYNYYLKYGKHNFDYIICPKPEKPLKDVSYAYINEASLKNKISTKFDTNNRFNSYFNALKTIVKPNEKYIIQIIDNSGLVIQLDTHLKEKYTRCNFYIQYYYQGFDIIFTDERATSFLSSIDEMLFLTEASYQRYKDYFNELIYRAAVMNNAVNSKQFYKLNPDSKVVLRKEIGIHSKLIFMWCSQDRPKKGLQLILDVWKRIYSGSISEMQLLIIGVNKEIEQEGVKVIGRVPNDELAKYYQISDFYLFPSLWKEGFGIVLAEALKCGCYCIASNQGGIPEVLKHGALGKIINNPNFIDEWVVTIRESIIEYRENNFVNPFYNEDFSELYDLDLWCDKMNNQIDSAKLNMN